MKRTEPESRAQEHEGLGELGKWGILDVKEVREQSEHKILEIDQELEVGSESYNPPSSNYLKRKVEVEEETAFAERKLRRFEARSRIVEAENNDKFPTIRASYLELISSLLTKKSRHYQSAFLMELENN